MVMSQTVLAVKASAKLLPALRLRRAGVVLSER